MGQCLWTFTYCNRRTAKGRICCLNVEFKSPLSISREFNYITNIIDGIILLDNKIKNRIDPINIGSNNPIKISELVRKIHKFTNSKSLLKIGALKYRPNEIWKMQANNKFILSKD